MSKNKLKVLIISLFLIVAVCCTQMQQTSNNSNGTNVASNNSNVNTGSTTTCDASAAWVSNPQNPPTEIPLGANAQICQFHQFSWQWFISLMNAAGNMGTTGNSNTNGNLANSNTNANPAAGDVLRVFQNEKDYPLLQATGTNSCTATGTKSRLFVRTKKDDDGTQGDDFVLPERIGQAGGGASIYDQNGNVVFYEVRFSRDECSLDQQATMFPAGTTEIKVSYRVITAADKPNYVWINADINGDGKTEPNELLGVVGFHLVKSTALHPEFVWATFEHKSNVPECQTTPDPNAKWSFTSATCAAELPNSVNPATCSFNTATAGTVISGGTPTQICRVYHDGSMQGDNQYQTNVSNIDSLNLQLVGPTGYISVLPDTNPLAVLKNYMLVGALWENDVTQPSSVLANQRGSIQLANSTMETTFQMAPNFNSQPYTGTSNLQPATNCFACHGYVPNNNIQLSHIFSEIQGSTKKN
jgi:hypothetical protein